MKEKLVVSLICIFTIIACLVVNFSIISISRDRPVLEAKQIDKPYLTEGAQTRLQQKSR